MRKILSFLLLLLLVLGTLTSCGDSNEQSAKTVVGEVDGNPIYYDELYALASLYSYTAKSLANGDPAKEEQELDRLIRENIITNTAMLRLCEKRGLTFDESAMDDEIDLALTELITDSFEGDRDAYAQALAANGLTERYHRYATGVELLYNQLSLEYPRQGLVSDTDKDVKSYIQENFIHVYHLVLFYDESNQAEQLAKMNEALELLRSGEKSMYSLIKAGYSEDFLDPDASGYYLAKGAMDATYEEAAFALHMNEVSDIVDTVGKSNDGTNSSYYCVIQRFPIDDTYVDEHLAELKSDYYASVIYQDMDQIRSELTFKPNSFYDSLSLTDLPSPREGLSTAASIAIVAGVALLLVATVVVAIILIRRKPKSKTSVVRR